MRDFIEHIDRELFLIINSNHTEWLDTIMYYTSEKWVWIPFYLLIAVLIVRQYGIKALYIILPVILVILSTDQFSVLLKNEIARYRPCHNLELMEMVHKVNDKCGGKFGFVSSHSANAFGLFAYLGFMLKSNFKHLHFVVFAWACLLAYSRIYLGVHYPADIAGGAILGILMGYIVVNITKYVYNKLNLKYD